MGASGDATGDLLEVQVHTPGVATRQDQTGGLAMSRTDCAEDIGRFGFLVLRRPRPAAAAGPTPGDLGLLPDPGLVGPPELYGRTERQTCLDRRQLGGEVFLKSSIATSFWR